MIHKCEWCDNPAGDKLCRKCKRKRVYDFNDYKERLKAKYDKRNQKTRNTASD